MFCPARNHRVSDDRCRATQENGADGLDRRECKRGACPHLTAVKKPARVAASAKTTPPSASPARSTRAEKPRAAEPEPDRCPRCGSPGLEFVGTDPPERRPGQAIFNVFRCTECGEERRELREGKTHRRAKPRRGWGLSARQAPPELERFLEVSVELALAVVETHLNLTDQARKDLTFRLYMMPLSALYGAKNHCPSIKEIRGCLERLRDCARRLVGRPQDKRLQLRLAAMLFEMDAETRRVLEAGNVFSATTSLPPPLIPDGMAALLILRNNFQLGRPGWLDEKEAANYASIIATVCERTLTRLSGPAPGRPKDVALKLLVGAVIETYTTLTGRRPGFSRHSQTHAPGGPLFRLVSDVLTFLDLPHSPEYVADLLRDLT